MCVITNLQRIIHHASTSFPYHLHPKLPILPPHHHPQTFSQNPYPMTPLFLPFPPIRSVFIRRVIFNPSSIHSKQKLQSTMKKASNYAYIARSNQQAQSAPMAGGLFSFAPPPKPEVDLNVFVLTFDGLKEAEKNLAGGDPYECKKCSAILNKFSLVVPAGSLKDAKYELKPNESLWVCEFCNYPNHLLIEKEEIPVKDDVVYMLESGLEQGASETDSTIVFCIDVSGSMNTTSQIAGKVDLKFGLSQEELEMLKQFMQPGDEAQLNYLPGAHNHNKTFISRMQCVLSAIEAQIREIKKVDPLKKVGFILFNNEVLVLGDGKAENVSLVGDRLNNTADILNALKNFQITSPIAQSFELLLNRLNKTEAKGQTALGPALTAAIEVAAKGSKGSTVVLCTDGLANIGVGSMETADESKQAFYANVGLQAKLKNVMVNIITIKGESSKLEVLGKVVEATNGNVKVVNPQKLSQDFANVLKDEVVGLNVTAKIMLHKALVFRNEDPAFLKDNRTILVKEYANATVNTKISFEYQARSEEDLKFMEIDLLKLQKVPFQAQITYSSPKGGRFLRVISSQSRTTTERKVMEKQANINVVHQRVVSNTAAIHSRGEAQQSTEYNNAWASYLNNNFQAPQYQAQQERFNSKNMRLNQAIQNKVRKMEMKSKPAEQMMDIQEEAEEKPGFFSSFFSNKRKEVEKPSAPRAEKKKAKKEVDSDEDQMEYQNCMREKNDQF